MNRSNVIPTLAFAVALALPAVALATYSFEAPSLHPDFEPGIEALQRHDWTMAIEHLSQVVKNEPDNADAHTGLGIAYRHAGKRELAFRHFGEALRLKPEHRGAHESLGEAWLASGNKAKAREHLAALKRACGECEEAKSLARRIAAAK